MSRTLRVRYKRNGVVADADAVVLRDPANTFGVQRTDTGAIVVAAGTPMPRVSLGVYEYELVEPAPDLTYRFYPEITKGTSITRPESFSFPPVTANGAYQVIAAADALADTLPGLAAYKATTVPDQRQAALNFAGRRIDARRYQGRKYDPAQAHQFPRVAYESGMVGVSPLLPIDPTCVRPIGPVIWDFDATTGTAVVPNNVLIAELYEADSILSGQRDRVLNAIHNGLASQSVGGMSESYSAAALTAAGFGTDLSREAAALMDQYRLVSGRLL